MEKYTAFPESHKTHIPAMFAQGGPLWSVGQMHFTAFLLNLIFTCVSQFHNSNLMYSKLSSKSWGLQEKSEGTILKPY